MLCVYILQIDENLQGNEFQILFPLISQEKRDRMKKYHQYADLLCLLLSDILARYSICKNLNLYNCELRFSTNLYGKPIISSSKKIEYNISYAGHYIACAVSDNYIGIDLETIKPINLRIVQRFFLMTNMNG